MNKNYIIIILAIITLILYSQIIYKTIESKYISYSYEFKSPIDEDNYRSYTIIVKEEVDDTIKSAWIDNKETALCLFGNITDNSIYINKIRPAFIFYSGEHSIRYICNEKNKENDYYLGNFHTHPTPIETKTCYLSSKDIDNFIKENNIIRSVACMDFWTDEIKYDFYSKRSALNHIPLRKEIQ